MNSISGTDIRMGSFESELWTKYSIEKAEQDKTMRKTNNEMVERHDVKGW